MRLLQLALAFWYWLCRRRRRGGRLFPKWYYEYGHWIGEVEVGYKLPGALGRDIDPHDPMQPFYIFLVRCPAVSKPNQPRKDHIMSPDTSNTLCRTPHRLVITVCLVLTSLGCTRTADKFCGVDQETLKRNLIRLVESPVIKEDDGVNATSITIDSIEPLPISDGKAEVSFVVRWTTGVGDARADHSGKWQANLKKAEDGYCHVTGVAVRSGDTWIKAINPDFEIK